MWSSWSSLGARSTASEWVQRPEMHAHHAPGAWPSALPHGSLGVLSMCWKVEQVQLAQLVIVRNFRNSPGRIKGLDWHQQRLGSIRIPRTWTVIPMSWLSTA